MRIVKCWSLTTENNERDAEATLIRRSPKISNIFLELQEHWVATLKELLEMMRNRLARKRLHEIAEKLRKSKYL